MKLLIALALFLQTVSACTSSSTAPGEVTAITVKVVKFGSNESVVGAKVSVEGVQASGSTDVDGTLRVVVPLGTEFTVGVSAPGYQSVQASGTINVKGKQEEVWIFWLEPNKDYLIG